MTVRVTQRRSAPLTSGPTGSVYLDAPRPSRYRTLPRKRAHGSRTVAAALLGIVGLLALTTATLLAGVRVLVSGPDPAIDAIGAALDEPVARQELEREIAAAIESSLVGEEFTAAAGVFGLDVRAEATRVAGTVLDDPAFRTAVDDLVSEVHHRMLVTYDGSDLDLAPITDAVIAVIEAESPDLALILPTNGTLATIDGDSVPDLTGAMSLLDRVIAIAVLGMLAIPLAAFVHPRRHRVVAWLGRWLLCAGLAAAVLSVTLPYLGSRLTGWSTAEVAIRATSMRLLAPAGLAGIVGMGLVSIAAVAKSRERHRVTDEGAAAALGVDEPPLLNGSTPPELDLPRRGLVDAGQTLTSI